MKQLVITLLFFRFLECAIPQKVIICGVGRNIEDRLPYSIEIIEKIGSMFEDYQVMIYENNSTDLTPSILSNWAEKNKKVSIRSEHLSDEELAVSIVNRHEAGPFFRPELIARARNIVLDRAMSEQFQQYPYVIWIDLDFRIHPNYEGIQEVFDSNRDWDAVFAYGMDKQGNYWDWYAFRDAVYPFGSEVLGNRWWYMPKSFRMHQTDDWYPVISAFGGFGIYKKSSIAGCRYAAIVTKDLHQLCMNLMEEGRRKGHPQVALYDHLLNYVDSVVKIDSARQNLPLIKSRTVGISLFEENPSIIWRMSSFVFQYPTVCEHVPFHASMIAKGHDKLFINPRLVFTYN